MAEELVAQADAVMCAFDQAGKIGQHEIRRVDAHDAELRVERGEGVVRDLGLGLRDACQESRFACIGQSDQPDIRDQLQLEDDGLFFARLAGIGMARRLIGGALEMRVAETAIAAAQQHHTIADIREIGDQRLAVFLE